MWLPAAFLLLFQTSDPLEEGRKALDANQYAQAAELFQKAVVQDPKDYTAHFQLALVRSLQNDAAHAIPEYEKTLELKPGLYQADLNLGILLLREKRAADAIPHLESAVAQKPKDTRPQYQLAEAYLLAGAPDKAEPHFAASLEADPKSAAAELGLARAALAQGHLDQSAPHFRKAAELDPKYREALLEVGSAYEKAGRTAEAVPIYQQFPENPGAQEHLGELLLESKQYADAIPRLEKAVADSPTAANRMALAAAYRMNKQPQKSLDQLAKASASEPANYDLRMVYGRTLRDEHQLVPAAQQFYAAAQIKATSVEAWNELASVLIIHEDYVQGLAALDKVKALGAELPGDLFLRAITLDRLKQRKPALESYQQFLTADNGKNPDQEFQARQRIRLITQELTRR